MKLLDYVTMPRAIISALLKIALTLIIQFLFQFSRLRTSAERKLHSDGNIENSNCLRKIFLLRRLVNNKYFTNSLLWTQRIDNPGRLLDRSEPTFNRTNGTDYYESRNETRGKSRFSAIRNKIYDMKI